jgi:LCP family protein required for cell wall assembly
MRPFRNRILIWLTIIAGATIAGFFITSRSENATKSQPAPQPALSAPAAAIGQPSALAHPVAMMEQMLLPDPERVFGSSHLRILVVGLDYDYDAKDQQTSKSSRSDIIMAIGLDLRSHRVVELSVPRDMVATLPDGKKAKINQAQSDGGIKESEAVVADWLGIPPFDRHVVLRIDATSDLINALGGIDVEVKNSDALRQTGSNGPLDYDDSWGHLHVHLKPGLQHLDGEQAVGYARFRHDWCSDPCRILRQQQVVRAIVDKIQHDRLNTIVHAKALLDVVRKDVETNLTPREELALVLAFRNIKAADIQTAQVPYVAAIALPDYGDSIVPDEEKKAELASLLLSPQELALQKVPPAAVHLVILNGTSVPGLAGRYAQQFASKGFVITRIGDAPQPVGTTRIIATDPNSPAGRLVQETIGTTSPQLSSSPSPEERGRDSVTIVLGHDVTNTILAEPQRP